MQDLPRTEIKQTEFGEALFTVDAVPAGAVILSFDLDPMHVHPSPTRFSVQVDKDKHLDTPGSLSSGCGIRRSHLCVRTLARS